MTRYIATFLLIAASALGCNPNDEKVFKGSGNAELKPQPASLEALSAGDTANKPATEAANVTYVLKVISNSGANLCTGEASVTIMTDFALKIPDARIQCVSLSIDLAGVLGAGAGLGDGTKDEGNLSHDGKVLSIKTIANGTFDPPRPFLIGPVVQNVADYKNYKKKTSHSLTGTDPAGKSHSAQGSFEVEVLEEKTEYTNDYLDKPFTDVLHWQMTTSGFDDVPASVGLIFEKWEWAWNTRPIMIPGITIVGRLSDFIQSEDGASDQLVGRVTIKLLVKDYDVKEGAGLK